MPFGVEERERHARVTAVSLAIDQCILPLPAWQESTRLIVRGTLLQRLPYGSQKREIRNPMAYKLAYEYKCKYKYKCKHKYEYKFAWIFARRNRKHVTLSIPCFQYQIGERQISFSSPSRRLIRNSNRFSLRSEGEKKGEKDERTLLFFDGNHFLIRGIKSLSTDFSITNRLKNIRPDLRFDYVILARADRLQF